jgi:hypothetical protein
MAVLPRWIGSSAVAFDPEFLELMDDTLGWEERIGEDAFGNPRYAVQMAVRAHVEGVMATRGAPGDREGTEGPTEQFVGTIYTPVVGIKPLDRLMLPAHMGSMIQYVDSVNTLNDEQGPHHHEIQFEEGK